MCKNLFALALLAVVPVGTLFGATGDQEPARQVVLETRSPWRCFFVWQEECVQFESGEPAPFRLDRGGKGLVRENRKPLGTPQPPADWVETRFDDGDWITSPGPIVHNPYQRNLAAICLRGSFRVDDPARAGQLTLSLAYRGGARVFVNGREIARAHLPEGEIEPTTPAEGYPRQAYIGPDGMVITDRTKNAEGLKLRTRVLSDVRVAPSALRKGQNALAVELHRAPTDAVYYTGKRPVRGVVRYEWSMLGFERLSLKAEIGACVGGGGDDPKQPAVWIGNPLMDPWDQDACPSRADDQKLDIVAARNGAFTGVLLLRSPDPIKALKVEPSALQQGRTAASISASRWEVRYGRAGDPPVPGSAERYRPGARHLGVLAEEPPANVAVPEGANGVTLPVWLTLRVSSEAAPGDHAGTITITVNDRWKSVVPVSVWVADWRLPNPTEFSTFAGIMQSPESVALQYGVPLWSDRHWALLEEVFAHLGRVGVKSVFIPVIARTNLGNEQSMVRWIRRTNGPYEHDFSVVDRYLDLTAKHLGRIPVVCFYVWTPAHGGRAGWGKPSDAAKNESPMLVTLLNPSTGETKDMQGPDWGMPQSVPFWRPVFQGLRKRLTQRGFRAPMALGMVSDYSPSKLAVADLNAVAPEARWVTHAHGLYLRFAGRPAAVASTVWKGRTPALTGHPNKRYGWRNAVVQTMFSRWGASTMGHVRGLCPPGLYHALMEGYQAAGFNGFSRMGADFWPVIKGRRGRPSTVISRYSYRNRPGPPTMTNGTLLFPGPEGPLATVRFEILRLGIQEAEARISVEKALLEEAGREKLGQQLTQRMRNCLDGRVTALMRAKAGRRGTATGSEASWLDYAAGHSARARELFQIAAAAAARLRSTQRRSDGR